MDGLINACARRAEVPRRVLRRLRFRRCLHLAGATIEFAGEGDKPIDARSSAGAIGGIRTRRPDHCGRRDALMRACCEAVTRTSSAIRKLVRTGQPGRKARASMPALVGKGARSAAGSSGARNFRIDLKHAAL